MNEDLNTRLKQAAQGTTPQTKPDERRKFLGSLRERVLIRMNNDEVKNTKLTALFLKHISDYKNYTILINGNIANNSFLNKIEEICSQKNIKFTLINNETAKTGSEYTALLVVSNTAINKMRIEIDHVYSPEIPKTQLKNSIHRQKKRTFWQHLFGGK